jgi:hypothetical protein
VFSLQHHVPWKPWLSAGGALATPERRCAALAYCVTLPAGPLTQPRSLITACKRAGALPACLRLFGTCQRDRRWIRAWGVPAVPAPCRASSKGIRASSAGLKGSGLAVETCRMAKKPQPPKLTNWNVYKIQERLKPPGFDVDLLSTAGAAEGKTSN